MTQLVIIMGQMAANITLDTYDAVQLVINWGNQDWVKEKIDRAWGQKGGWEGWAQVELAMAFQDSFHDKYWVYREQNVYNNKLEADIVLQPKNQGVPVEIIELKVQGFNLSEDAFVTAVKKDLNKIINAKGDVTGPALIWAMAITVTDHMRAKLILALDKKYDGVEQFHIVDTMWVTVFLITVP